MAQITLLTILTVICALSIGASVGLSIWVNFYNGNERSLQNDRQELFEDTTNTAISGIQANVSSVNMTLCDKIMTVNSTLSSEVDLLLSALNLTNQMGSNFTQYVIQTFSDIDGNITFLYQQDTLINTTFTSITDLINIMLTMVKQNITDMNATFSNGDETIILTLNALTQNLTNVTTITIPGVQTNVTNLQSQTAAIILAMANKISTLNLVLPVSANMNLVSGTPYSLVINSSSVGNIDFYVNAVTSVNGLSGSSGALFIAGASGISINDTAAPNTITVDGSTLVTAITNLQQEDVNQDMQISSLNSTSMDLQTQINNLNMTGTMIAQALNGTTITFNMTLMTLVNDVMTLMSQVAILQAQIANLTAVATPTGTIVPWGGSASPPTGYLACDGAMVDQSTYAALYAVVGCKFCASMTCSMTDFCLPDLRGKLPVAQSATPLSAFNVPPGTSNVGEEKHTLTTGELPLHTHTFTTAGAGSHGHSVQLNKAQSYNDNNGNHQYDAGTDTNHGFFTGTTVEQKCGCGGQSSAITFDDAGGAMPNRNILFDLAYTYNGALPVSDHTHSGTTDATGSATSHNVVQPSVVVAAYMIKT